MKCTLMQWIAHYIWQFSSYIYMKTVVKFFWRIGISLFQISERNSESRYSSIIFTFSSRLCQFPDISACFDVTVINHTGYPAMLRSTGNKSLLSCSLVQLTLVSSWLWYCRLYSVINVLVENKEFAYILWDLASGFASNSIILSDNVSISFDHQ